MEPILNFQVPTEGLKLVILATRLTVVTQCGHLWSVGACTKLLKLLKSTSPSLQNLTVDLAAIFSQNFGTTDEEVG